MQAFAFSTAGRIIFGAGTANRVASEVTRNAVIRSSRHRVKVSMRSQGLLPDLAVVDPELTLTLPPAVTAATGFDALTQLLEAFVSVKANPLTDGLCREGLVRCVRSLKTVYHHVTVRELHIPPLTRWGLKAENVTELAEHALRASSMRGNPVPLKRRTLEAIICKAMQEAV